MAKTDSAINCKASDHTHHKKQTLWKLILVSFSKPLEMPVQNKFCTPTAYINIIALK